MDSTIRTTSPLAKISRTKACCAKSSIPTAVNQRYAEYIAITVDGVVKNGILVEETGNAITLRRQQGEQTTLLRSELESLVSSGKSLMPEGLENQISPQEMADLVQFLATP